MVNIDSPVILFWFRRDLRLHDNPALFSALQKNRNVLPVYIFDTNFLSKLENIRDPRVNFIFENITKLKSELEKLGSTLLVRHGETVDVIGQLIDEYRVKKIYTNHDYEPTAIKQENAVFKLLENNRIDFLTFKDHVIFEKDEVRKTDGNPFVVYTYYMRQWKSQFQRKKIEMLDPKPYFGNLVKCDPSPKFEIESIGFERFTYKFPPNKLHQETIRNYHLQRDIPSIRGTSRIGIHLRYGTVSIREIVEQAYKWNEIFLDELIWREFYQQILWHFPYIESKAFKPKYDEIPWRNDEREFQLWCQGRTGYALVDAGMKELNRTGYMHNRLRMITASFLTKHLLIDWRWGEAYFASKLQDYELASNNGGWQWAAGTGCDAVPYFRIFNPEIQMQKIDPKLNYIRRWIPDYNPNRYIKKIIDHSFARQRALKTFKEALGVDFTQPEDSDQ